MQFLLCRDPTSHLFGNYFAPTLVQHFRSFYYDSFSMPFLILARVSSLPMRYDISTPPPGVNALPETATLRGHRTIPFFTPSLPIRSKSASWIFSSVQSSTPSRTGRTSLRDSREFSGFVSSSYVYRELYHTQGERR